MFWYIYGGSIVKDDFMIFLIALGIVSGIISGMGVGGGTLLIPMIVLFKNVSQQTAQNINLIYFIPTAIISLITHKKNNNIQEKIVLKIVIFGFIGAAVGSMIAMKIEPTLLKKIFACFLCIMGILEIFKKGNENEGKFKKDKK